MSIALDQQSLFTITIFLLTIIFLLWRPREINEAFPTSIGAALLLLAGIVPLSNLVQIAENVGGASITILSTIIMSIILDSIGLFRWAAHNIVSKAKGSGIRLYWYINLLCFLMTIFFNNDGSILITTPIIIQITSMVNLKNHQKIPYLLSGALIATASSAPIGISNFANLISLKIVGLDLNSYTTYMFIPSMIGITVISALLYFYFKKQIPQSISPPIQSFSPPVKGRIPKGYFHNATVERWIGKESSRLTQKNHPLADDPYQSKAIDWGLLRVSMAVVILTRGGLFAGPLLGIPMEWVAVIGAVLLILIRWYRNRVGLHDIFRKTPWYIILFAFSIYIIVFALHNIGLTSLIVTLKDIISSNHFFAVFVMGSLLTLMSNLFNNIPSVMIGTLTLSEMGLDIHTLQVAYLANIIGSDIGSLLTPMGTLASLIWMFILRSNRVHITWKQYLKVTLLVIPIGLFVSLLSLYTWTRLFF